MTTDEKLNELAKRFPHLPEYVLVDIRAALREAHALGREEEREKDARACDNIDGDTTAWAAATMIRQRIIVGGRGE